MQSAIIKRSIIIDGHKTSVSLEDEFWNGLKEIGKVQKITLSSLVHDIDVRRVQGNLSSALRLFVLDHFRAQIVLADPLRVGMETPGIPRGGRQSSEMVK